MRIANPTSADAPDGWRAFLPEEAAHFEEFVLLQVAERKIKATKGPAWRVIPHDELESVQRSSEAAWSTTLLLPRADLANAEAVISNLRGLGFRDEEIHTIAYAWQARACYGGC